MPLADDPLPSTNVDQPQQTTSDSLDDSEPHPWITRNEVNHALESFNSVIQTTSSTTPSKDMASLLGSITALMDRIGS